MHLLLITVGYLQSTGKVLLALASRLASSIMSANLTLEASSEAFMFTGDAVMPKMCGSGLHSCGSFRIA